MPAKIPKLVQNFYKKHAGDGYYRMELETGNWSLRIYQPKMAQRYQEEDDIEDRLPGWFVMGDNGGDELLFMNKRTGEMVLIPRSPMDESDAIRMADSWEELVAMSTITTTMTPNEA